MVLKRLKTYFRSILDNRFFSFINFFGLISAILVAILIYLFVHHELTHDTFHKNHKRIYRLEAEFNIQGKIEKFATTQAPLAPTLADDYTFIESYTRIMRANVLYFGIGDSTITSDDIFIADSTMFEVFDPRFIAGDPQSALTLPHSIVLSEALALQLFGSTQVLGDTLTEIDGSWYVVTGVYENLPSNTHLRYRGLISMSTLLQVDDFRNFDSRDPNSYWNVLLYSYILLKEGYNLEDLLRKATEFFDRHMSEIGKKINGDFVYRATPIQEIHLNDEVLQSDVKKGNRHVLTILILIALLILVMASVNYVGLTTAQSATRFREIGIKKAFGVSQNSMAKQFVAESALFIFAATFIAVLLAIPILPKFNNLTDNSFTINELVSRHMLFGILGINLLIALLSGVYPACFMASLNPVQILKGRYDGKYRQGTVRKILVVTQFTVSSVMIVSTLLISNQIQFMKYKEVGFNRKNIIVMALQDTILQSEISAFKDELMDIEGITAVAFSNTIPIFNHGKQVLRLESPLGDMMEYVMSNFYVDHEYLNLMGMEIIAGRNFLRDSANDLNYSFLINETAALHLGWTLRNSDGKADFTAALGKRIDFNFDLEGNVQRPGKVIGIVKDFNVRSLHFPVEPMLILLCRDEDLRVLNIKLAENVDRGKTLQKIEVVQEKLGYNYPLRHFVVENELIEQYEDDTKTWTFFQYFTVVALIIAVLGLFGLSTFLNVHRTKEISIRKAIGASGFGIIRWLMLDYIKWILISNLIAIPLAYYCIKIWWLDDFAYTAPFTPEVFLISIALTVAVAFFTVIGHVIKASKISPAQALKTD